MWGQGTRGQDNHTVNSVGGSQGQPRPPKKPKKILHTALHTNNFTKWISPEVGKPEGPITCTNERIVKAGRDPRDHVVH